MTRLTNNNRRDILTTNEQTIFFAAAGRWFSSDIARSIYSLTCILIFVWQNKMSCSSVAEIAGAQDACNHGHMTDTEGERQTDRERERERERVIQQFTVSTALCQSRTGSPVDLHASVSVCGPVLGNRTFPPGHISRWTSPPGQLPPTDVSPALFC